jgi:MraZ protein
MLLGEHEHALDDKNRLTLPARLREHLGDRVVVTAGWTAACSPTPATTGTRSQTGFAVSTRSAGRHA